MRRLIPSLAAISLPQVRDGWVRICCGLALVDLVADLAQQFMYQACPTVTDGLEDEGEIRKEMRPAYLMLALEVCKVCAPAIVDQYTGVARIDADRLYGIRAPLAMQELECQ